MKLFDYYKKEDFGVEHIIILFKGKRRSFLQFGYYWTEHPDTPYLQITFGGNRLIDIISWCWKIGFSFELFGITWRNWNDD